MARAVLCALLLFCVAHVHAELKLVYYFNRYGARNVLPKSSLLQESNATGGPTLLPIGRLQNRAAGVAFRSKYLDAATCGSTCLTSVRNAKYGVYGDADVEFHNYNSLIRSSGLDRTVTGAYAFLGGAFPDKGGSPDPLQTPPVYSQTDSEDWLIRSYTKCNAYLNRLASWYQSDEFKAKEAATKPLRDAVAAAAPNLDTSLKNWASVTDAIRINKLYGYGDPYDIGNKTFDQIVDLGNWLQSRQMSSEMTGTMLGGPLLADMLSYMGKALAASGKQIYYKLLGISSHYNVLMMVSTALKLDQGQSAAAYPWLNKIPSFASLMAFELHQDGDTAAVKLVYSDGPGPASQYVTMPLPCAKKGSTAEKLAGAGACSWEDFQSLAAPGAINSMDSWCGMCGNRVVQGCKAYWLKTEGVKSAGVSKASGGELAITGLVVGGGCILLTLAAVFVFRRSSLFGVKYRDDRSGTNAPMFPAPLV